MSIFSTSGQGVININYPQRTCIIIDENRIMGAVVAWLEEVDKLSVNIYICAWLPPAALHIMRLPVCELVKVLNQCNSNIRSHHLVNNFLFKDKKIFNRNKIQYIH